MAKKKRTSKKPVDAKKAAAKTARREARKAAEAESRRKAEQARKIKIGVSGLVAIGVVVAIMLAIIPGSLPGVTAFPSDGRVHLAVGETTTYPTATPTSGTHSVNSPACGVISVQLPTELAIHTLEHGGIVIWYRPDVGAEVVAGLADIVNKFDDRVILSPNAQLDGDVVVTSWRHLKAYGGADPEIEEFIDIYRFRGPENVPCTY